MNNMYTADEIAEMADTWANYNGFSGERCGGCGKTANVLAGGVGWFCECEYYNIQSVHFYSTPHETPDIGPARETIRLGHNKSLRFTNYKW